MNPNIKPGVLDGGEILKAETAENFSKDLANELIQLAIKHHAQDILDDVPVMNESELMGTLNYLHRIDYECNSDEC